MISIVGNQFSEVFLTLKNRLTQLSIAFEIVDSEEYAFIRDGILEIKDKDSLEKYLIELEQDLEQWYYCV